MVRGMAEDAGYFIGSGGTHRERWCVAIDIETSDIDLDAGRECDAHCCNIGRDLG
jgi:hypothetical protein